MLAMLNTCAPTGLGPNLSLEERLPPHHPHLPPWTFLPARQTLPKCSSFIQHLPAYLSCPHTYPQSRQPLNPTSVPTGKHIVFFALNPPHQNRLCYFFSSHPIPNGALTPQVNPPTGWCPSPTLLSPALLQGFPQR